MDGRRNALISGGPWPVEEKALGRKPYANYCIELLTNLVTMLLRLLYEDARTPPGRTGRWHSPRYS